MSVNATLRNQLRKNAELVASVAQQQNGLIAKFDETGVRWLDGFIQTEHDRHKPDNHDGLMSTLGAFLGECIMATYGGDWEEMNDTICVRFDPRNVTFPFVRVLKHLQNGKDEAILPYFLNLPSIFVDRNGEGKADSFGSIEPEAGE